jgi:hypothetical protein
VLLGIGLIGVVKGFARSALGLGDVMSGVIARLKHEGADPDSANSGFDFNGVMYLLQRAVLLADALRARLRSPAVAIALARFGVSRAGAGYQRPPPAEPPELDETQGWIAYLRTDDKRRECAREAIEGLSDREVLTHIYANLLQASAMLGETDVAAEVRALGCKASALLGDEAGEPATGEVAAGHGAPNEVAPNEVGPNDVRPNDVGPNDVGPDTAATRQSAHANTDKVSEPDRIPGPRPPLREVGRGPP